MMRGLVVAVSKEKEWLLPWWWLNYTLNSTLPVTFEIEGSLSPPYQAWCEERSSKQEFDETIRMEPWCQIRHSLDPLFARSPAKNHDVIAYKKGSSLQNCNTFSDEEVSPTGQYLEVDAAILNWGLRLEQLKSQIQVLEHKFLYKLSL